MLGLPAGTELHKPLPKKLIYEKFALNAAARERFDRDISRLVIVHEVSSRTLAIAAGEETESFYVLRVVLKQPDYSGKNIELVSKLIKQKLLMLLEYDSQYQLALWRERLLKTSWAPPEALNLELNGLDMDAVWQGVIRQVGGINHLPGKSLDEQIRRQAEKEALMKKIEKLEKQVKAEKQPRKKFDLAQEISKTMNRMDSKS